jgi:hypothetical protein
MPIVPGQHKCTARESQPKPKAPGSWRDLATTLLSVTAAKILSTDVFDSEPYLGLVAATVVTAVRVGCAARDCVCPTGQTVGTPQAVV